MTLEKRWRSQLYICLSAVAAAELLNAALLYPRSAAGGWAVLGLGSGVLLVSLLLAVRHLRCPACGRGMAWAVCSPETDPRAVAVGCPNCGQEIPLG